MATEKNMRNEQTYFSDVSKKSRKTNMTTVSDAPGLLDVIGFLAGLVLCVGMLWLAP